VLVLFFVFFSFSLSGELRKGFERFEKKKRQAPAKRKVQIVSSKKAFLLFYFIFFVLVGITFSLSFSFFERFFLSPEKKKL